MPRKSKGELMSYVYQWKVSNGDEVFVEYCWSSMDKCIKVVEMKVNGKFHRINWMSSEGRACLLYTSPSQRDATLSRMPSSA